MQFFKPILLAVVGAVGVMVSIPRDEAVSNLSTWWVSFGLPPFDGIRIPAVDNWVLTGCIAVGIILLVPWRWLMGYKSLAPKEVRTPVHPSLFRRVVPWKKNDKVETEIPLTEADVPSATEDYSQLLRTIDAAVETILKGQIPDVHLRYITTKLKDRGIEFYIPDAIYILRNSRFRDSLELMRAYIGEGDWENVRAVAGNPLDLKVAQQPARVIGTEEQPSPETWVSGADADAVIRQSSLVRVPVESLPVPQGQTVGDVLFASLAGKRTSRETAADELTRNLMSDFERECPQGVRDGQYGKELLEWWIGKRSAARYNG